MESTLFKISEPSRVSGVLYGPITLVYGLGGIALTLADKYILSKIKCNKVLKIILSFIILALILTTVEFLSGYLCKLNLVRSPLSHKSRVLFAFYSISESVKQTGQGGYFLV